MCVQVCALVAQEIHLALCRAVEWDGTIESKDVALGDVPSAVQTSIHGQVGNDTLDIGGFSATIGGLNDITGATGGIVTTSSGTPTLTFGGNNADGTFSGTITRALGLTKQGTGSETLTGTNTFTGNFAVSNGTMVVGNSQALGLGMVNMLGCMLQFGNGNHQLNLAAGKSYTQTAGTLVFAILNPTTNDQMNLSGAGNATLNGTVESNLAGFTAQAGKAQTLQFNLINSTNAITYGAVALDTENVGNGITATYDTTSNLDDLILDVTTSSTYGLYSLSSLTPNQQAVGTSINNGLVAGNATPAFTAINNALTTLYANNPAAFAAALDQLSPQAFGQFTGDTAFNNASFETQAMDGYLENQCSGPNGTFAGGNGSIDASGLTVNDPSYDPNLAMVHSRLLAWNPAPYNGTISDVADPLLGGVDVRDEKDSKDTKSDVAPAYNNPWNFFVRGNVILAQGLSNADVSHFDDNTESIVLGADYRLTPNFLVGLTAGYGHTDATLDNNGSSATVDSYSPGLYASYADKGWYANFNGDYVHNAYTQSRVIGFLGQTANSAPEGNQGTANVDGGYDFHRGALTFGPLAGVQYTHLTVDGYNETGSVADLSVNNQEEDSLRSRLGSHVSYAFSTDAVTFTPHLDASWQHEFMDQGRGITSQFNGAGLGSFTVRTTNLSRDSALVDAGFDADLNRTVTLFTDYIVQAGQDNYFGQSVQAGVKIGF